MYDENTLSKQILRIEEECFRTKQKCIELENILSDKNNIILSLQTSLQIEKFKSHIYSQIIASTTQIKLNDIWNEDDTGIYIRNFEKGNIPIIVRDYIENEPKNYNLVPKKKKIIRKKSVTVKKIYKSAKETVDEDPTKQEEIIRKLEEDKQEIIHANSFDVSYKNVITSIENIFRDINSARVPKKHLILLKTTRFQLLGPINLEDYLKLLKSHVTRLETILVQKKLKSQELIFLTLTPLDQRLLNYYTYYNTEISADDTQKLEATLKLHMKFPTRYIPFNSEDFFNKLYNYSIALFPIKNIFTRILVNLSGFNNIIYYSKEEEVVVEDPYSFYILEKVEEGKRFWRMECRLDDFSKNVGEKIQLYCVSIFRKIYSDVFFDNTYRHDYKNKAIIFGLDCEQLITNIIAVSQRKSFCNMLRTLVMKKCNLVPTSLDKFNLTADDKTQKRTFQNEKDDMDRVKESIKMLFDNISDDDALEFLNCYVQE